MSTRKDTIDFLIGWDAGVAAQNVKIQDLINELSGDYSHSSLEGKACLSAFIQDLKKVIGDIDE